MLTIAVTGSTGFVGRHLVNAIKKYEGIKAIPLTRGREPGFFSVTEYSESPSADILIHLAQCNTRQMASKKETTRSIQLIESLVDKNYKTFLYVSSGTVYGDQSAAAHHPSEKVAVEDEYTRMKLLSEEAVLKSAGGVVVRPSNIYGLGMSELNVMSAIFNQLNNKGPTKLRESSSVRDFIWIDDVIDAIIRLALRKHQLMDCMNIYNVSSGVGISIEELAKKINTLAMKDRKRVVTQTHFSKPSCLVLDSRETINGLGWMPKININEGISIMLKTANMAL